MYRIRYAIPMYFAILLANCQNYGLLNHLENPGGHSLFPAFESCGTVCRIFVTAQTRQGNFGGPDQADQVCMSDPNRPPGNRLWKAMLVGGSRKACGTVDCTSNGALEHIDWVLRPGTEYRRPDGTLIASTTPTAGIWGFPVANSVTGISALPWTGLDSTWVTSANICHNPMPFEPWVRSDNSATGRIGQADQTSSVLIHNTDFTCNNFQPFYCVEQ